MVGYDDMMEMLTNYEYTIDYTSDGAAETWGAAAGYGIMSARKMLAWVKANCDACSGMKRNQCTLPLEVFLPCTLFGSFFPSLPERNPKPFRKKLRLRHIANDQEVADGGIKFTTLRETDWLCSHSLGCTFTPA